RATMVFSRALASASLACSLAMSSFCLLSASSICRCCFSSISSAATTRVLARRAPLARSSRPLVRASSARRCHSSCSRRSVSSRRSTSLRSAMMRTAEARTSTSVSSISWMIRRMIFSGSSARSRMALILEFTMSVSREKIPISVTLFLSWAPWLPLPLTKAQAVPVPPLPPSHWNSSYLRRIGCAVAANPISFQRIDSGNRQTLAILTNKSSELPPLIGESPAFRASLAQVSALAPLDRPVLVVGERGTGKELVAARLTYLSPRWDRPFVKLNCAALAESLLDSELFGHEAGAFTGATRRRLSRFEIADGGTLFLDEIANASLAVQEKILRVIEYGSFERVGGNTVIEVDVRILAATNLDLPRLAAEGKFRADLLDRLAFDVVTIPPLRARTGDVALLAEHFARAMSRELGHDRFLGFTADALARLAAHRWPGNVRELKNVAERSVHRWPRLNERVDEIVFDPFASPHRPPAPRPEAAPPPAADAPEAARPPGDFL